MAKIVFDEKEIDDDITATVNPAGLAYVGRKHKGKKVRILVMKGSNDIAIVEAADEVTVLGLKSEAWMNISDGNP